VTERPTITVVGLGPGDDGFVTEATTAAIAQHTRRYLRTARHPNAHLVPDAVSLDSFYESADTFDDVYRSIVDHLVDQAHQHGPILYAVPGSPLILERTVQLLRSDDRVATIVHPALSFLDVAYDRLGIDPVDSGVRLIDAHQFAVHAAGHSGPMLIAHTHANWVLSDVKLSVDGNDDAEVVILKGLGTDHEQIVRTTWSDMDRSVDADHLTSVYVPGLAAPVGAELVRFHQLARTLREKCPWDQEQTHHSLVKYLVEETYELVDALQALDPDDPSTDDAVIEELGDVLYQIEFHATIAEIDGRFTMADVARNVHDKLVRRHPHVFGDVTVDGSDEVVVNWDAIKQTEKQRSSVFDGIATSQPALSYADALQRKAAKVGFDWPDLTGPLAKIHEELGEVLDARDRRDDDAVAAEIGDLLFSVVNTARHLGVEPESALRSASGSFRQRFEQVERLAAARGIDLRTAGLPVLDALWDEVKTGGTTPPSG
jgi:tetrapyrrole methylase family protein / MazG family protein